MMDQAWLERIAQIQGRADEPDSPIRPTEVFNEGWMLRLTLDWMAAEGSPTTRCPLTRGRDGPRRLSSLRRS